MSITAPDKDGRGSRYIPYLSYLSMMTYVVGTHKKCLSEALLMSTTTNVSMEKYKKISIVFIEKKKNK